jgi:hypothetical protein
MNSWPLGMGFHEFHNLALIFSSMPDHTQKVGGANVIFPEKALSPPQQYIRSFGKWGQSLKLGAPAKRASTRVKVPPVQLDGSAPKTVPTASPRGGVGSRHGVEPAGRNDHMNHINEPRKNTPGSRAPQLRVKAAELKPRPTVAGFGNGPAGSAWATCREVTLG